MKRIKKLFFNMNLYDEFFFVTEPNSSEPKFFFLSFPKIYVKI